jgi:hypothetical protein
MSDVPIRPRAWHFFCPACEQTMVMGGECEPCGGEYTQTVVPEARAVAAEQRVRELREALDEALAYVPRYFIEKHDMRAPLRAASVSKEEARDAT